MILNAEMSPLKLEKIHQAEVFFDHLGSKDLRFFGIAGSVSYEPESVDDVDIFIITDRGKLWKVLLKAFITRRRVGNEAICISLTMDESYAADLFARDAEYVVASDAVHVIPLFGDTYYETLLTASPFIERYFPSRKKSQDDDVLRSGSERMFPLLNYFIFILLAPYLIIRSLRNSRILSKTNEERNFQAKTGIHHFFLDSVKYRNLKRKKGGDF